MSNPRELAQKAREDIEAREAARYSDFVDALPYFSKFGDGEERVVRVLPPRQVFEYLLENPDKTFTDYTTEDIGPGQAWHSGTVHFGIGSGGTMLPCLKEIGSPCPVCEAYKEDIKSDNDAIKKAASQIRPQHKYNFIVEWRGHEDEGPFVWTLADQWANMIIAKIANKDYTVLYDPLIGHDLRVTRHGTFTKTTYDIEIRPDETFVYTTTSEDDKGEYDDLDFEKVKSVLEVLPDITKYLEVVLNYEEYEAILNDDKTIGEVWDDRKNSGEKSTDFNPEKLEKESEPSRRRRRR